MKICVVTDNEFLYKKMTELLDARQGRAPACDFFYSPANREFAKKYGDSGCIRPLNLKAQRMDFFSNYQLYLSLHCKQLFPDWLVRNCRCVNVHPGYNPYNRGWYPQVFSILNGLPAGVTIHEMDGELDHGPIIFRETIPIGEWETSGDVYQKIQQKEAEMLDRHLDTLISGRYETVPMEHEGTIHLRPDFVRLCRLDLDREGSFGDFLKLLRALTFDGYQNAHFFDSEGNPIFVEIKLSKKIHGGG